MRWRIEAIGYEYKVTELIVREHGLCLWPSDAHARDNVGQRGGKDIHRGNTGFERKRPQMVICREVINLREIRRRIGKRILLRPRGRVQQQ